MAIYYTRDQQNLFDVALQLYGDSQYILQVCLDNDLSLSTELVAFQPIQYDDTVFKQTNSTIYLALNNNAIVSADLDPDTNAMLDHNPEDYDAHDHN
jgi:replicative DNA helicase